MHGQGEIRRFVNAPQRGIHVEQRQGRLAVVYQDFQSERRKRDAADSRVLIEVQILAVGFVWYLVPPFLQNQFLICKSFRR